MAARSGVARCGQQRSLVKMRQVFTVAARSPSARALAMLRLTARWLADSRLPLKGDGDGGPGSFICLVGQAGNRMSGQLVGNGVDARGGQVVHGAGQRRRGPQQPAGGVGQDLHVDAVAALVPVEVRLLIGDPVDRDQRAVQDHPHRGCGPPGHRVQGRRRRGNQVDAEAATAARESVSISERNHDRANRAMALAALGGALTGLGDLAAARAVLDEAHTLSEETGDQVNRAEVLNWLARLQLLTADPGGAHDLFVAARDIGQRIGEPEVWMEALIGLASCALQLGDPAAAIAAATEAKASAERSGALVSRTRLLQSDGVPDSAFARLTSSSWWHPMKEGVAEVLLQR